MRRTVTLAPDVESLIHRAMKARGISFTQALNDAIRAGASSDQDQPARYTTSQPMGVPAVPLDRALLLAAELEDEDILRRMRSGR
ncbi:MAG: hypothetical protein Q4D96_08690 [Propionibacteriaceae bacterium]|nr:hypothetical protein [Propionibacteriaceae bacterium]